MCQPLEKGGSCRLLDGRKNHRQGVVKNRTQGVGKNRRQGGAKNPREGEAKNRQQCVEKKSSVRRRK